MHDVHSRRHYMDVTAERADIDKKVSGKTVCTIFADAVRNWPDRTALRWKRDGEWQQLTWREYGDQVASATLALSELGFGPDQFGLIMARNVPEHVIADLAIVHAGGAAISVYNTLAPEQLEYVANHSAATGWTRGHVEPHLHVGHHRTPEGRHLLAQQRRLDHGGVPAPAELRRRCAHQLPAAGACRGAVHVAVERHLSGSRGVFLS